MFLYRSLTSKEAALCSFRKFLNAESKGSAAGGGAGLDDDTVRRRVRRFGVMFYGVAPSSRLPGQAPRSRLYQRRTLPPAQIVANAESALRGGASGRMLGTDVGRGCDGLVSRLLPLAILWIASGWVPLGVGLARREL
jgi:hypothetical protein